MQSLVLFITLALTSIRATPLALTRLFDRDNAGCSSDSCAGFPVGTSLCCQDAARWVCGNDSYWNRYACPSGEICVGAGYNPDDAKCEATGWYQGVFRSPLVSSKEIVTRRCSPETALGDEVSLQSYIFRPFRVGKLTNRQTKLL